MPTSMSSPHFSFSKRANEAVWASLAVGIAFVVIWHTLNLSSLRFDVPLTYKGDALALMYTYDIAQGFSGAPASTGMPFGTNLYDAPNSDGFNLLAVRAFELATGQFGTAFNLYYLATILIVGLCAYAVGRRLGLMPVWACALSILFNVLPFHWMRIGGIFYDNYVSAAVTAWIALDFIFDDGSPATRTRSKWPLVVVAAIFCGTCGIYYAFFSCLFIGAAALLASLYSSNRKSMLRGFLVVGLIAITSVAQWSPSLLYLWQRGINTQVAHRQPFESEIYGLKLVQMLLPIEDHRIGAFADLTRSYLLQIPQVNENKTSALGMIGATGFLFLLAVPLLGRIRHRLPENVKRAASLAWIGFLYATIGGLGSLFAWLVSPQLRGLSRIVIFLAFFALFAFIAVAQDLASKARWRYLPSLLAASIVIVGVFDMTPSLYA